MSEIYFLGTGGAAASLERDNTSLLIRQNDDLILLDCPGSAVRKVKMLGLDPRKIKAIFITHTHPDHVYGLPAVVHNLMLDNINIALYGSRESVEFCSNLLDLFQLQRDKIRCRIDFKEIEPGNMVSLSPEMNCTGYEVPHKTSSLAYHFSFPKENKEVLYSGDTPPFPELFKLSAGFDTVIHDCSVPSRFAELYPFLPDMHTDSLTLGKLAQKAGIKRLVPVHFFGEVDYSISEIEAEIRQNFSGELFIPSDLSHINI